MSNLDWSNLVASSELRRSDGRDEHSGDFEVYGSSVQMFCNKGDSISGDEGCTLVVKNGYSGFEIFHKDATQSVWMQEARLAVFNCFNAALTYNTVALRCLSGTSAAVYRRDWDSMTKTWSWKESQTIQAGKPNGYDGDERQTISITDRFLAFGRSEIQGDDGDGHYADFRGVVYVYTKEKVLDGSIGEYDYMQKLEGDGSNEAFGFAVALDGDYLLVGAPHNGVGGAVYVFEKPNDEDQFELLQMLSFPLVRGSDSIGMSLAIRGDHALVGASRRRDVRGYDSAGSAFIFKKGLYNEDLIFQYQQTLPTPPTADLHLPNNRTSHNFGYSVALGDGVAAVGGWDLAHVYTMGDDSCNLSWCHASTYDPLDGDPSKASGGWTALATAGPYVAVGSVPRNVDSNATMNHPDIVHGVVTILESKPVVGNVNPPAGSTEPSTEDVATAATRSSLNIFFVLCVVLICSMFVVKRLGRRNHARRADSLQTQAGTDGKCFKDVGAHVSQPPEDMEDYTDDDDDDDTPRQGQVV